MNPITHLWQSTVCAGIAALLAVAFRRAPARTRHAIWLAASVKFLVPLALLTEIGEYAALSFPSTVPSVEASLAIRWFSAAADPVASGMTPGIERTVLIVALTVWAAGAIGLAFWRWNQWTAISRMLARTARLDRGREVEALAQAPRASAGPAPIAVVQSDSPIEPGVVGILRPALVWPLGLSERLSDAELRAIVAHEAAHVDRRDNLTAFIHTIVETIFWLNPVVWWIGAQLVNERERACDEAVIEASADTRSYAEGILKVCGFCLRSPAAFVAGVGSSNLRTRIEWIVNPPSVAPFSMIGRLALAAVIVAVVGTPIATGAISAQQESSKVYRTKDTGVTAPKIVQEVKPQYTQAAMQAKIQGMVRMEVVILDNGTVGNVEIVQSLDKEHGLDDAAVTAVKQWLFEPGKKDDMPVNVRVEIEMTFTLK